MTAAPTTPVIPPLWARLHNDRNLAETVSAACGRHRQQLSENSLICGDLAPGLPVHGQMQANGLAQHGWRGELTLHGSLESPLWRLR